MPRKPTTTPAPSRKGTPVEEKHTRYYRGQPLEEGEVVPPRVVFDFDGVLHDGPPLKVDLDYERTESVPTGVPCAGAVELCEGLAAEGYKLVAYTERAIWADGLLGTSNWLKKHGFPKGIMIASVYRPADLYVGTNNLRAVWGCPPSLDEVRGALEERGEGP